MLYWLIPYLVSYNASDIGNWKYGPEHLFKVESVKTTLIDNKTWRSVDTINFSCRPLNSSFCQCRVESAIFDDYEISTRPDSEKPKFLEKEEYGDIIFQIEFDKMGPRNVNFINFGGFYRRNMIRAIVGQFNVGTDLSDKKSGKKYFFDEKSVNGICETSFSIKETNLPFMKDELAPIEGFNFDVPSFSGRVQNLPIIIEKRRKMNDCSVKTHYFFGNTEEDGSDYRPGLRIENNITRSESIIYLGKTGFSSYTENEGTMELKTGDTSLAKYGITESKCKVAETMRIKLVAIRPAKEKLKDVENY